MATLAVTTTFVNNTTADGTEVNTNFSDVVDYVNDRNDGTAAWEVCNITATTATPHKISSNQATTTVEIDNTATDGDPVLAFELGGTAQFTMGVDDGDSDTFKIGTTAIGTSTMLKADSTGAILKPLQPAFLAYNSAQNANVTGDGTNVTVEFDTEVYDQNGDFNNTTDTFTAPVTGRYYLSTTVQVNDLTTATATTIELAINTSNNIYSFQRFNFADTRASVDTSVIADMDASDTATVSVKCDGATAAVDIQGSGTNLTRFSGCLLA